MNLENLTEQQQRDLQEVMFGVQQTIDTVALGNIRGTETDFLERFRATINKLAATRMEQAA
jgi:hypothetical protein